MKSGAKWQQGEPSGKTSKKPAQTGSKLFEQAKATVKLRKRKERQESVNSVNQDKKVIIRSNSEERPPYRIEDNGMRRVSSSGDFPQNGGEEPLKTNEPSRYEDYDKTRSFERFAKPHHQSRVPKKYPKRYKGRVPSKPTKSDSLSKKNNNGIDQLAPENTSTEPEGTASLRFLDLSPLQDDRSPSPTRATSSPNLDFSSLYDQLDTTEPIVSQPVSHVTDDMETMPGQLIASNKMASSPRNSIIATRRIYLDPNVPQVQTSIAKMSTNPIDERIEKLTRLIDACRKKIVARETEAEERKTGSNKANRNDATNRKLHAELDRLRREQKHLTEISVSSYKRKNHQPKTTTIDETVKEIETRLKLTRATASRDLNLDHLTEAQLIDEKIATQKALLFLESVHGRPQTKHDRDLVRPFYDRYRLLKQTIVKMSNAVNGGELATIDENETMHFVASTSSSTESATAPTDPATVPTVPYKETATPDHIQTLRKPELLEQMRIVKEEKRALRAQIKEFERAVQDNLGRMLTKEDKKPAEDLYVAYKRIKGRLRLIEVLIGKC